MKISHLSIAGITAVPTTEDKLSNQKDTSYSGQDCIIQRKHELPVAQTSLESAKSANHDGSAEEM